MKKIKRILIPIVLLLFISIGIIAVVFLRKPSATPQLQNNDEDKPSAIVTIIEGTPLVKRSDSSEFSELEDEASVYAGEEIKTDDSSRGMILFANNSSMSLDYNTLIRIESVPDEDGGKVDIFQQAGKAWNRIQKLSDQDTYEVKTPTTIAAVRGTKFISHVKSTSITNIHTVENTVNVSAFIDGTNWDNVDLPAGDWIDVDIAKKDEYKSKRMQKFVFKFQEAKDSWFKFNECLDKYIPEEIKDVSNLREKLRLIIKQRQAWRNCRDSANVTPTPSPTPTSSPSPTPSAPRITQLNAGITGAKLNCSWDVAGQNISGYEYSIGSVAGGTDVLAWQQTNSKNFGYDLTLNPNTSYKFYCNVKVKSRWGQSVKSSGLLDPAKVAFTTVTGHTPYYGYLGVDGSYSNVAPFDVKIKFTIKNTGGQYWDGVNWVAGSSSRSFQSESVTGGNIDLNTYPGGSGTPFNGATLYIEARNAYTGVVIGSTTKTMTYP